MRETTFEFNQQTTALNLNLRKTVETGSIIHSFAYGGNFEETDTRRPRNRCEENLSNGLTTCAISEFPFAPPERAALHYITSRFLVNLYWIWEF